MKKTLAISTAVLVLAASANNLAVYLSFKLHQAEIAAIFCINKNKPALHCEGKCYLNERLAEANDQDRQSAPIPNFEETLRINFFPPVSSWPKVTLETAERPSVFEYLALSSQPFLHSFFQPPESQSLAL